MLKKFVPNKQNKLILRLNKQTLKGSWLLQKNMSTKFYMVKPNHLNPFFHETKTINKGVMSQVWHFMNTPETLFK